jgi:hypothetical protein
LGSYWAVQFLLKYSTYSPNFSELAAVTVRRLAWAMDADMGQAVDVLVKALPAYIKHVIRI